MFKVGKTSVFHLSELRVEETANQKTPETEGKETALESVQNVYHAQRIYALLKMRRKYTRLGKK